MAYVIHEKKPYFFNGKGIFPCSISADKIKIDFDNPVKKKINFTCVYSESEIKHCLGIFMVDGWDSKKKKVVKVSNQTISSIKKTQESQQPPEQGEKENETGVVYGNHKRF